MGYMGNHTDIRNNPALLLDGAHSIICMAFSYAGAHKLRYASLPAISAYALFPDYHDWIRKLIRDSGIGSGSAKRARIGASVWIPHRSWNDIGP